MPVADMIAALGEHAKYSIPEAVAQEIASLGNRYGLTVIERGDGHLLLKMADLPLAELLSRNQTVSVSGRSPSDLVFQVNAANRGMLKQALLAAGYPAEDLAGYVEGDALAIQLRAISQAGSPLTYVTIKSTSKHFIRQDAQGGSGDCAACGGKTMVGLAAMTAVQSIPFILPVA
jgi:DNA excision repair protein ERCC-3